MAKTIVAALIGIAVKDGAIGSIADPAEAYVPGLKGTEYGRTPIKALLQMSSGVVFRETYAAGDDIRQLGQQLFGQSPVGSIDALKKFNNRARPPGQQFSYSSAETLVLGLVLAGATRRPVADYAREKLWQPLGAEADAKWLVDAAGQEITFAYFNATLRDWARLGLMLAHDGTWNGRAIVPREWLVAATSIAPGDERLKIVDFENQVGYGFQTWLLPGRRRAFFLDGSYGQRILVDPEAKLVMVHTAAYAANVVPRRELLALWDAVVAQLR
jgi:CubicO group peptidase (beta-lactamase class C family)